MAKRLLCVLLALLMAGSLVGCTLFGSQKQSAGFWDVFDTASSVTAYGLDKETFARDEEKLHGLLMEYHQLYDIYNDYEGISNLKTVNARAGGEPVAVDTRILDLLEYGRQVYTLTGGRVNILFGSVLALWHASREAGLGDPDHAALPDSDALRHAAEHTSMDSLVINREAGTVCLTDPEARLDVGAIAKGYATERAAEYAEQTLGWTSAMLSIGGNVRPIGTKGGRRWEVGVQNPDASAARAYLLTVKVAEQAVVTSGDYQRYYTVNGQRYAHIIDVDTLYPATFVQSVTVICPDSALADALSTTLFTLPVEEGLKLLRQQDGAEAVWVMADGSLRYSDGFGELLS